MATSANSLAQCECDEQVFEEFCFIGFSTTAGLNKVIALMMIPESSTEAALADYSGCDEMRTICRAAIGYARKTITLKRLLYSSNPVDDVKKSLDDGPWRDVLSKDSSE